MKDYRTELEKKIECFLNNGDLPHPKKLEQADVEKMSSIRDSAVTSHGSLLDLETGCEIIGQGSLRMVAQTNPYGIWKVLARKFLDLPEQILQDMYNNFRK